MVEKEKIQGEEQKGTAGDAEEGDKPETLEVLKQQSSRIKELEADILKREEEKAKQILGGKTEAGQAKEVKKDETDVEYTERTTGLKLS